MRVFFQSFGEMFLDEMRDSVSVAIFMLLLIVLQLVLNNTVLPHCLRSTRNPLCRHARSCFP